MKELLIAEMKRALELLEKSEHPFRTSWNSGGSINAAELKRLMLSIRQHSIECEKLDNPWKRT